jgi:hypothetical protein
LTGKAGEGIIYKSFLLGFLGIEINFDEKVRIVDGEGDNRLVVFLYIFWGMVEVPAKSQPSPPRQRTL